MLPSKKMAETKDKTLGSDAVMTAPGFADTTNGCVVTAPQALALLCTKESGNAQAACKRNQKARNRARTRHKKMPACHKPITQSATPWNSTTKWASDENEVDGGASIGSKALHFESIASLSSISRIFGWTEVTWQSRLDSNEGNLGATIWGCTIFLRTPCAFVHSSSNARLVPW